MKKRDFLKTFGTAAIGAPFLSFNSNSVYETVDYSDRKDLKEKEYLRDMSVTGIAVGKTGLEKKLDKDIIGKVGFQRYEVNAYGKRIRQIQIEALEKIRRHFEKQAWSPSF